MYRWRTTEEFFMKYCLWGFAIVALVMNTVVGNVQAVGYERHDASAVARSETRTTKQACPTVWDSLKQLSYVDKVPDAIDGAVSAFKDVLGQFGLNMNRKP
jgi:hypothetical protein